MHYTIFSCSPQSNSKSTSYLIARKVQEGLTNNSEDVTDIFSINNRNLWNECREAFYESETIIFVIPLYVESVPGLFLEFLETIDREKKKHRKMSFIIQGGFEEASQLRVAEEFLKGIPEYFNCSYAGTVVKGGLFGMATIRSEKFRKRIGDNFKDIMKKYKENNEFDEILSKEFAGAEFLSRGMLLLGRLTKPLNRLIWYYTAKKLGAKCSLEYTPYNY